MDCIEALEVSLGKVAIKEYLPLQAGDVLATHASTALLGEWVAYKSQTSVSDGVAKFVAWYKKYYENELT